MIGQIADHFAQRKIVATDEFLEGTPAVPAQHVLSDAAPLLDRR
jgi:hypothetical protein